MIILKHLTVERFRLLREVNLHFPQRGSILIQGPNEAGKSTIFESIYFALYGEPLASRGRRSTQTVSSLDDLIFYGATTASVTLTFSVGAREMMVTRSIERGQGQNAALSIRELGAPEQQPITSLEEVDRRVIEILHYLDGTTLRNSGFVEQKGLNRLEGLSFQQRQDTLRRLLGVEKLQVLRADMHLTDEDEQQLRDSSDRLRLAELQQKIPELSHRLGDLELSLDAITVTEDLTEIEQQETEIAEQTRTLEQLQRKRHILRTRQSRVQQLKKADSILGEIIEAYDAIAEAQRETPELERQIAELERREHEELPQIEERVHTLSELTRSFGTLERMASDLLTSVNDLKVLEQEVKEYEDFQQTVEAIDEQMVMERQAIDQMRQAQREVELEHQHELPKVSTRLEHLREISRRLQDLHQAEKDYQNDLKGKILADENQVHIRKVLMDIRETEQEQALTENEAKQLQQQVEVIDHRWRQVSTRRQLEEWVRVKALADGLREAEGHVWAADQKRGVANQRKMDTHRETVKSIGMVVAFSAIALLFLVVAVLEFVQAQNLIFGAVFLALAILMGGAVVWSGRNFQAARNLEIEADREFQGAVNQVSMMIAAREAAGNIGGRPDELARVERELHSLGVTLPASVDEGRQMLETLPDLEDGESLTTLQQRLSDQRDRAMEARNQVNVTMEAVASLRKDWGWLDEQRRKEGWGEIEDRIRDDENRLTQIRRDVTSLAQRDKLPAPVFSGNENGMPANQEEFEAVVEAAMSDAEHEMTILDGKLESIPELALQAKMHEDALDTLLVRKQGAQDRQEEFEARNPHKQIEEAREQQNALREALRNLQDSLRERVKPLGVSFGQAAISSAEGTARKQLEDLHIVLGNRVELESRRNNYETTLRERQESLSDYYKLLSKFSSSIGSWVVPLNPFAEALVGLRTRCEQEIEESHEEELLKELDGLRLQEGALNARIALCEQEIEEARERIATMLAQRNRPQVKAFSASAISAVWPLTGTFSPEDRSRLEEQHETLEDELAGLEHQELELSRRLQVDGTPVDIEKARQRLAIQERAYQTKKYGPRLIDALNEQMMQQLMPRTEHYMQLLLPLITGGRYHDVRLTEDGDEDRRLQVKVWESAANEYVSSETVSGGTADQLSLALRLAFAVAALPQDLTGTPGFLLLDEPLSAFDRDRTRALVDVITGDVLGQHFEQVLFISHSNTFDPAMFPYHIYMDNGMVVESNLPVVPVFSVSDVSDLPEASEEAQSVAIPRLDEIAVPTE